VNDHIDLIRNADTVEAIVEGLLGRLRAHSGGRTDDDIALLAIEICGATSTADGQSDPAAPPPSPSHA